MSKKNERQFEYDVCLSFAGEQRKFVEDVAAILKTKGVRVFFDDYEQPQLWGKDLYAHLDEVYQHGARYCVLFASAAYAEKVWTNHERRSAQARALKAKGEYILPARFDDTPIPGLPDTVHYINLKRTSAAQLAELVVTKLGNHERRAYLPPVLDKLFERLGIEGDEEAQGDVRGQAHHLLQALQRMNDEEREVVLKTFWFGCPAELPENVHMDLDLLRRVTGRSVARLKRILGGLRSLGFTAVVRDSTHEEGHKHAELGQSEMLVLVWRALDEHSEYPSVLVAREAITGATEGYCEEHGWPFLGRLDFSQLGSATATVESPTSHAPDKPLARRRRRVRVTRPS